MTNFSLETATIGSYHAALRAGEISARELTAAYLARIGAYDKRGPAVKAVLAVNPQALEVAEELDARQRRGWRCRWGWNCSAGRGASRCCSAWPTPSSGRPICAACRRVPLCYDYDDEPLPKKRGFAVFPARVPGIKRRRARDTWGGKIPFEREEFVWRQR